jgi:amidohydrolase
VHTTVLLGVAKRLAANPPDGLVRLLFQAAEEKMPGGALAALEAGVVDGIDVVLALHCDPTVDVGQIGLREGPITAACDQLEVVLSGPGGHTSRPQNTVDLVYALGALITGLPGALSRRVDARSSLSLVWGRAAAGSAVNAIPQTASVAGTVRVLDHAAWERAPELVTECAREIVAVFGATVDVRYVRGVPPVVNDRLANGVLEHAVVTVLGAAGSVPSRQSLGGEDFGWFGEKVPSAMGRLGTRTPNGVTHDLHQPAFDVDERCLEIGVDVLETAARQFLDRPAS